mmetsp:Transcript_1443/g.4291  ORF Transcript_1443/g.4291 Transcript_1443/m.4291 type:complete len:132 (-) Transcript_1443:109-504(-)|eukprot:CAMPEP_0197391356 /NCGR_PEP_ID=MMETSP1165-20131217/3040_1 /TAXON_ID=284809 /ORGANISM="Chrysocystis fragilis, Strain CCMP3189" /LENGTH=131 /DNA_ID=CAMNT_0042916933 /DNA_START=79 /DNA_END=474 /DNA_ORIENTATION=-
MRLTKERRLGPKGEWSRTRLEAGAVSDVPECGEEEICEALYEAVSPRELVELESASRKRRASGGNKRRVRSKKTRLELKAGAKVWATWFETDPTPYPAVVQAVCPDCRVDLRFDDGFIWERAPAAAVVSLL